MMLSYILKNGVGRKLLRWTDLIGGSWPIGACQLSYVPQESHVNNPSNSQLVIYSECVITQDKQNCSYEYYTTRFVARTVLKASFRTLSIAYFSALPGSTQSFNSQSSGR